MQNSGLSFFLKKLLVMSVASYGGFDIEGLREYRRDYLLSSCVPGTKI